MSLTRRWSECPCLSQIMLTHALRQPRSSLIFDVRLKMKAIERIQEKLIKYPEAKYSVEQNTITVVPQSDLGFTVWLTEKVRGFTVGFDGWHEEFDEETTALNMFAFGLSEDCRLKVIKRGRFPCSWTYEERVNDEWNEGSTTGLIFTPFWLKKSITYHQNHLIKSEQDA